MLLSIPFLFFSCGKEEANTDIYKTKNVVVLVMDGPRYSETHGEPNHQYTPRISKDLAPIGTTYTEFYNHGSTYTVAGHTALTTGHYQIINNVGLELPQHPSIFQYWKKTHQKKDTDAWIIASKDKIISIGNCQDSLWKDQYLPATICGENGWGTGYVTDSFTFARSKDILTAHHPQLVLLTFREPDFSGHQNNWDNYLQGIRDVDEYIYQIWDFLENDPYYQGNTTLFVTNDHGRHLDTVSTGFINHGDQCVGCTHINLFACGPDFKKNQLLDKPRELVDIPATIAELLRFQMPNIEGQVMWELFK